MPTDPVTIAAIIVLGGAAGAFAGSLIHAIAVRLPAEKEPIGPPVCANCQAVLTASHLVPALPRACPSCGSAASRQKLATEAGAALITVLSLLLHGLTYTGVTAALFSLVLLVILRIDWQHHLIYTVTIAPGIMLALAAAALRSPGALLSATIAAAGAGLVFAFLFGLAILIYRQQALGFGDILLAALIGAMTGVGQVVPALFLGMVLAAAGGLLLIATGVRSRRDFIPYGAYLCAGTIVVLLLP